MNYIPNANNAKVQLPVTLSDGRIVGRVDDVKYTHGGLGNQWTTISGARYATFWDIRTRDWTEGDVVVFSPQNSPLCHGGGAVPQASGVTKFDLATIDDYQYDAVILNRRERDVLAAALRLLAKCLENGATDATGEDVGGATCVQPNDGDIGDIMTSSGDHRGMSIEEVDAFCNALLDGKLAIHNVQLKSPRPAIEVERASA